MEHGCVGNVQGGRPTCAIVESSFPVLVRVIRDEASFDAAAAQVQFPPHGGACSFSVFGSFGHPAHAFFAELSRRTGGAVPPPLLPSATWAALRLAPFARMAVSTAVRRGLASAVWSGWARAPAYVDAPPDPAPD